MARCYYNGFQALIKQKSPHAVLTHCIIHREALASKSINPTLHEVLQSTTGIQIVNFIKTRSFKFRYLNSYVLICGLSTLPYFSMAFTWKCSKSI